MYKILSCYCKYFFTDLCEDGCVRLVGSSASDGRVEICVNLTWTTICDEFWDYKDAMVTCRQLGSSPYGNFIS